MSNDAIVEWQNEVNEDLSDADRDAARGAKKPIYLVVPKRNRVKVYRP